MPFERLWNFFKRHRRKILYSGVLIGGTYLTFQYFKKKLHEFQEKEAAECIDLARRQHHFDSNQRTCNMTVLSMLPNLRESLRRSMDTEKIKASIESQTGNKLDLWEELKVMSFSRSITAAYSSSILVVLLRVQLNIMGGYLYLDNFLHRVDQVESDVRVLIPSITQEKYLSLIQFFITKGVDELSMAVHAAVKSTVGSVSLKEKLSLGDVQNYLEKIRMKLECGVVQGSSTIPTSPLCHFMLPPEQVQDFSADSLPEEVVYEELLAQTRDMIDSEDFHSVLQVCVNKAFARFMDFLMEGYRAFLSTVTGEASGSKSIHDNKVPLAKLIPVVNGIMVRLCGDSPNPFIQELLVMEPLRDLAANVYEAFSQQDESCHRLGLTR
ncbi:peroxisomal biogenesis factor 3-like [Liolophura sinensis]|uniref:peroxisomal biogenesis factor 3-like n=1 Tax=Liolophura sinensis TaxID=3198878 RepID=UPI003158FE32